MIAGRGWFARVHLATGTEVWRGDPADVPFNHSCDPNSWWSGEVLVARRDIRAGDELTVDYATGIGAPSLLLRCHCESYWCRQMVTGEDWRIPQLQRRYVGHWAPAVLQLLRASE